MNELRLFLLLDLYVPLLAGTSLASLRVLPTPDSVGSYALADAHLVDKEERTANFLFRSTTGNPTDVCQMCLHAIVALNVRD